MNHNVTQTLKIEAMSDDMSIQEITRRLESVGVLVSDMTINPIIRKEEFKRDPDRMATYRIRSYATL